MKRFLICLFSLLALTYVPVPVQASIEDAIEATCRVRLQSGNGFSTGTGCAFEIRDGEVRILTNYHVAENAPNVLIEFWHRGHKSTVLAAASRWFSYHASAHRDICVVAVPVSAFGGDLPNIMPLAPRGTVLVAGQPITSCGCEEGRWPSAWRGHVVDYADNAAVRFEPKAIPGRSGSSIFNEDCTEIVGLVAWHDGTYGVAMTIEELYRAFDGQSAVSYPTENIDTVKNATAKNSARVTKKADIELESAGRLVPVDGRDADTVDIEARRCIHGYLFTQFCPKCPTQGCGPFGCPPQQPRGGAPRQPYGGQQPQGNGGGIYPTLPPNNGTQPTQPAQPPAAPPVDLSQYALKSELAALQKQLDALSGLPNRVNENETDLTGALKKLEQLGRDLAGTASKGLLQSELEKAKSAAVDGAVSKLGPAITGVEGLAVKAAEAKALSLIGAGGLGWMAALGLGGPIGIGLLGFGWIVSRASKKHNDGSGGSGGATPHPFRPSANIFAQHGPTG